MPAARTPVQNGPPLLRAADIVTAGAYVQVAGCYPFVIGAHRTGSGLALVRLGGHREPGETAWDCAAREAYEEARLSIRPLAPPACYWLDGDRSTAEPVPVACPGGLEHPTPLLVVSSRQAAALRLSAMYLATADQLPVPDCEARGLLLLRPAEIQQLARQPLSLRQFLRAGGQAILHEQLDEDLLLEPLLQLRVFARILQLHQRWPGEP